MMSSTCSRSCVASSMMRPARRSSANRTFKRIDRAIVEAREWLVEQDEARLV